MALWACALSGALAAQSARAQDVSQTFDLEAGWNAIHVRIQPSVDATDDVFASLPVESVWTWSPRDGIQYLQNPGDLSLDDPSWNRWFPATAPDPTLPALNDLHILEGNRAYLVRMSAPATLVLTGKPLPPRIDWAPGAFHLTGLPVGEGTGATFASFLAASPAHGTPVVYRIDPAGREVWELLPGTAVIDPDEAYWIFTDQGSNYVGPIEVRFSQGDRVDYAASMDRQTFRIINRSAVPRSVDVSELDASPAGTLSTRAPALDADPAWLPLPLSVVVPADGFVDVTMAVRKIDLLFGGPLTATLVVRDSGGSEVRAPVTARSPNPGNQSISELASGLWVGSVEIDAVSAPQSYDRSCLACPPDDPSTPGIAEDACSYAGQPPWVLGQSDGSGVCLELAGPCSACPPGDDLCESSCVADAICVDAQTYCTDTAGGGAAACASSAGKCLDPATLDPEDDAVLVAATPMPLMIDPTTPVPVAAPFRFRVILHRAGNGDYRLLKDVIQMFDPAAGGDGYVLITDDTLIPDYAGIVEREGERVGRRISTAAYDFPGRTLPVSEAVQAEYALEATVPVPPETNPFRHKFHPDHGTAPDVTRTMHFEFVNDPTGRPGDLWTERSGTYSETVSGLHKMDIHASGSFRLFKLSDVIELDGGAP